MNIHKNIKKAFQFGLRKTSSIIINRLKSNFFDQYNRRQALKKKARSNWYSLSKKLDFSSDFSLFFSHLQKKELSYVNQLLSEPVFNEPEIEVKADKFVQNCFSFLGSGECRFDKILWHEDFRLKKQDNFQDILFNPSVFYKDIIVKAGTTESLEKDIKLPWELSRFQHLIILGKAYQKTSDKKYVQVFTNQLTDWLDNNPYLLGPNWVCPMDVALRSINWIIGFVYFKNTEIDQFFWQRFVCSLYDHMIYLENNWEIYDSITSNHYLSDLIGYFYLCWFFSEYKNVAQKTEWCFQEILKEFEKQVFDEGTDYESSTNYHVLITELFYHFYLLAPELGFVLPSNFTKKFNHMFNFIDWCTPQNGNLVQIGDNDSGKVVSGISGKLIEKMKTENCFGYKHFPNFGISILKTNEIHLSLRHHAFQAYQPTAHFHNDAGSITLAINGIEVFVDPGSYVYTSSAVWRNRFRSVVVHNTFYIDGVESVPFEKNRLFTLDLPENRIKIKEKENKLYTIHDLYQRYGLHAHRKIEVDEKKINIFDWWQNTAKITQDSLITAWNFTLSPTIDVKKINSGWLLLHENQEIVQFISTLKFECIEGFYSPSYGIKVSSKRLVAHAKLNFEENIIHLKW